MVRGGGIDVSGSAAHTRKMGDDKQRSGESAGAAAEARRQRIVAVVTEMGEVTAGRLRAEVGGRTATAYADLAALLNDGTLIVEHKGRKMLYRLASPGAGTE